MAILLGLVPPAVWRFTRGARLQQQPSTDAAGIDRDDLVWQSWVSASAIMSILFMLISFGVIPLFGSGFLLAAEAERQKTEMIKSVETKIAAVVSEQRVQGTKIDNAMTLLTDNLASAKAGQIRLAISKRCKTTGFVERDEQLREIDRLQGEYFALKGYKYDAPTCAEL